MTNQELRDLGKLARKRCRDSAMSVTQLLDSDGESAAILMSIAVDMMNGAAVMLQEQDCTEEEALGEVLKGILGSYGSTAVIRALNATMERRKCSGV